MNALAQRRTRSWNAYHFQLGNIGIFTMNCFSLRAGQIKLRFHSYEFNSMCQATQCASSLFHQIFFFSICKNSLNHTHIRWCTILCVFLIHGKIVWIFRQMTKYVKGKRFQREKDKVESDLNTVIVFMNENLFHFFSHHTNNMGGVHSLGVHFIK